MYTTHTKHSDRMNETDLEEKKSTPEHIIHILIQLRSVVERITHILYIYYIIM